MKRTVTNSDEENDLYPTQIKEDPTQIKEDPSEETVKKQSHQSPKYKIAKVTGNGLSKLNSVEVKLVTGIAEFIEEMNPIVSLTSDVGAKVQVKLYKTLVNILNHDPVRFKDLYKWVIETIGINRQQKGAFHDRYVMRFQSSMNMSASDLKSFRSIVSLLTVTADIKNKKVVTNRVKISGVAETLKKQVAKDNLINFYYG